MQVQEAAAASEGFLRMPDAQLNLGILALALEKPKEAVQVPSPCLHTHTSLLRRSVLCAWFVIKCCRLSVCPEQSPSVCLCEAGCKGNCSNFKRVIVSIKGQLCPVSWIIRVESKR